MRNAFYILALALGLLPTIHAQENNCDCAADLAYLNENVIKLPSYKQNKLAYTETYQTALKNVTSATHYYDCLELLNRVLIPLNDWHMGVIEKVPDSASVSNVEYPVYQGDLDTLENHLKNKSFEDVEGIYPVNKDFTFGLVYNEKDAVYQAVILKTNNGHWIKGDIVYQFIPIKENYFKVVGAQYPSKRLISYHERINEGVILRAGFRKDTASTYYIKNPYPNELFLYKTLTPSIDYIKVGSFGSHYPTLREAENFYKTLEDKLIKPHLILDLRDNGGGGNRNSDILMKQLKKYVKHNHIYIIINASTGSNAEQFTVKLKELKNVHTYGDNTRGSLAYEIKPKDYHTLPSSGFLVILPSKPYKKYLKYETKGIEPDFPLDYKQDWIKNIQKHIESKN